MRFEKRRGADRHPARGRDSPRHAQGGTCHRSEKRPSRRRGYGLPGRQAGRPQQLKVGHRRRDVSCDRLANQEQRGHQGRNAEGQQAGRLDTEDPASGPAEVDHVVPYVDVRGPAYPGQTGPERRERPGPAPEPDQRAGIGRAVAANEIGLVTGDQSRRGEHLPDGPDGIGEQERPDHAHDADPDPRSPGWHAVGRVVSLLDLLRGGQAQGERVADALAVTHQEFRRDHHLVDPAGIRYPALKHHRALDGLHGLAVREGIPCLLAGERVPVDGEPRDTECGQRRDLRQRPDPGPVEAGLVRQHGEGGGQRERPQPADRRLAAPGAGDRPENRHGGQGDQQAHHEQGTPAPP
jgi:hypothetical protein